MFLINTSSACFRIFPYKLFLVLVVLRLLEVIKLFIYVNVFAYSVNDLVLGSVLMVLMVVRVEYGFHIIWSKIWLLKWQIIIVFLINIEIGCLIESSRVSHFYLVVLIHFRNYLFKLLVHGLVSLVPMILETRFNLMKLILNCLRVIFIHLFTLLFSS